MLENKTTLQRIIDDEVNKFLEDKSKISLSVPRPLDLSLDGSLVIDLNSSSDTLKELLSESHQKTVASYPKRDTDIYRKQLGTKICKVSYNKSVSDALCLIHDVQKVSPNFAGALFILVSGAIINPLHPLVALELLENLSSEVSTILVYSYDDIDVINKSYGPSPIDFSSDITKLIRLYQSKVLDRQTIITENTIHLERNSLEQSYRIAKHSGEDLSKEYYLVAHQLLTKGTFVPYYGTSVVTISKDKSSGFHLTPFKSCNINNHESTDPAAVCTGSTSNRTVKGLRTLHHANLGSPYESFCMTSFSKPYADACIAQSFNIYKLAKIIPTEDTTNDDTISKPIEICTATDTHVSCSEDL